MRDDEISVWGPKFVLPNPDARGEIDRLGNAQSPPLNPQVPLGGEKVFAGLAVLRVGALAERGDSASAILEDYPYLKPSDIELARLYTKAFPASDVLETAFEEDRILVAANVGCENLRPVRDDAPPPVAPGDAARARLADARQERDQTAG